MYSILTKHKFWRHGSELSKKSLNAFTFQFQPSTKWNHNNGDSSPSQLLHAAYRNEPWILVLAPPYDAPKHILLNPEISLPLNDNIDLNQKFQIAPAQHVDNHKWTPTPSVNLSNLLQHYLMLSKFRLTSLVVITTMAGYAMAPASFNLSTFVLCSIGTGLCSAAANSINQYHEVPFDAQMSRTKNRVLVKGLLTPLHAIGFAAVSATTGLSMLYYGVNGLTAVLGAANLFLYTSIYTPMKRFSILNTWIGSVVGSIPPVMGWVGCSNTIDAGAWILAGLLYAWQFPHFNALSWNLRPDYSRAGYRMMAVTNPGLCRRTALRYTVLIGVLSLIAPLFHVTNIWFAIETLPLNGYFSYLAWQFYKQSDSGTSRKLFHFSLIHLPVLMLLFLVNKKRWIFTEDCNKIDALLQTQLQENADLHLVKHIVNASGELVDDLEKIAVETLQDLLR